jgi:hypothetical protein
MARKAKPPPSALDFSPAPEWVSLDLAFAWAVGALRSRELTEDNLVEHFRAGRLPTAMWMRGPGGTFEGGTSGRLEPTFWGSRRLVASKTPSGMWMIGVWGLAEEIASPAPDFFVARAPLSKLYLTGPTPSGAPAEAPDAPLRLKPGPVPKYEWPMVVAAAWICRAKDGESDPTAEEMRAICERVLPGEYSPGLKEMQKVVNKLRALQNRVRHLDPKES